MIVDFEGQRVEVEALASFTDANGDGRVYPAHAIVFKSGADFIALDTSGWDGFNECGDVVLARTADRESAELVAWGRCLHSDPRKVFQAAVGLINKAGGFAALKEAVDWHDRQ